MRRSRAADRPDVRKGLRVAQPHDSNASVNRWSIQVLTRQVPELPVRPALAVALAAAALVWLGLAHTGLAGWRFFLASLAAVLGGALSFLVMLNARKPHRSVVRPIDLPLVLVVDQHGIHLREDRGPTESIAWSAAPAAAIWRDAEGAVQCLRVATAELMWTIVPTTGPGPRTVADGNGRLPVFDVPGPPGKIAAEDLARRHAPWEVVIAVPELAAVIAAVAAIIPDAPSSTGWRMALAAEEDPTGRRALRLVGTRLSDESKGADDVRVDLAAATVAKARTWSRRSPASGYPERWCAVFVEEGDAKLRVDVPAALLPELSAGSEAEEDPSGEPAFVAPDWGAVIVAALAARIVEAQRGEPSSDA